MLKSLVLSVIVAMHQSQTLGVYSLVDSGLRLEGAMAGPGVGANSNRENVDLWSVLSGGGGGPLLDPRTRFIVNIESSRSFPQCLP